MIVDVQLEGVVGAFADVDAAEAPVQVSGDVGGLRTLQVLTVRGLDVRRHLIQRQTEARQRRVANDHHLGKLLGGSGVAGRPRRVGLSRGRRRRHNDCYENCAK